MHKKYCNLYYGFNFSLSTKTSIVPNQLTYVKRYHVIYHVL